MDLAHLPTEDIAAACTRETQNYLRQRPHDDRFCLELFRRVWLEDDIDALGAIFRIYQNLVFSWVVRHSQFDQANENPFDLTSTALHNFYLALRGDKFLNFDGLPPLLTYMAACAHSEVEKHARQRRYITTVSEEFYEALAVSDLLDTHIDTEQFWKRVLQLLNDEKDRLLVRLRFVEGLSLTEIVDQFPQHWPNERNVTVNLQKILRRLFKDEDLRNRVSKITRKRL